MRSTIVGLVEKFLVPNADGLSLNVIRSYLVAPVFDEAALLSVLTVAYQRDRGPDMYSPTQHTFMPKLLKWVSE